MIQIVQRVTSGLAIALLGVLTIGIHASALSPQMSHTTGGMNHGASSQANCISLCTLAPIHKNDYLDESGENDNDEPQPPFYIQFQSSLLTSIKSIHSQEARMAIGREPPPSGAPAYITLGVFRA